MTRAFVWIIMMLGGAAAGLYLDNCLFAGIHASIPFHVVSFLGGALLLTLVVRISRNTGRTLAKFGRTGNVKKMETNLLVRSGAYKFMRHPMHLGLLFFPLGFALLIGSPSFILLIAPAEIVLMLLMIKFLEEPEAIRKFGNEYIEYKKELPWFCFKKECLKELLKDVPI